MPNTRFKGKSKLGYRGDVILEMDYYVGKLMQTLKHLGLAKNTIIILSSDNGPVLDDGYADGAVEKDHGHKPAGPYRGWKTSIYEGGTRVPFIIKWPGVVKQKTTSAALVSQVDLLASFANMLHVQLKPGDARDSQNIMQTLLGKSKVGRPYLVEQAYRGPLAYIEKGWKYIPAFSKRRLKVPQLYNLKADIKEQNNLAAKYPRKVKQMAAALAKIVDR